MRLMVDIRSFYIRGGESNIKSKEQGVPYFFLINNIKVILIFLVVFNHIIAFQLVKVNPAVRQLWYAITVFHMPAFIFVSGFLSKSKQNVLKNIQNQIGRASCRERV